MCVSVYKMVLSTEEGTVLPLTSCDIRKTAYKLAIYVFT